MRCGGVGGKGLTLNQSRKETVARQGELQLHKRVGREEGRRCKEEVAGSRDAADRVARAGRVWGP